MKVSRVFLFCVYVKFCAKKIVLFKVAIDTNILFVSISDRSLYRIFKSLIEKNTPARASRNSRAKYPIHLCLL